MKVFYVSSRHMPPGMAVGIVVMTTEEVRELWTGLDQVEVPDEAMKSLARELYRDVETDPE